MENNLLHNVGINGIEWNNIFNLWERYVKFQWSVFLGEAQEWGIFKAKIRDLESNRQSKRVKIASICDTTPIPYQRAII